MGLSAVQTAGPPGRRLDETQEGGQTAVVLEDRGLICEASRQAKTEALRATERAIADANLSVTMPKVHELVTFEYRSANPLTERIGWERCGAACKRNRKRMGCRRRRVSLDDWSGTQKKRVKHLGSLRCDR